MRDDGGSGWLDDWHAIQIDTGSVQRLATALISEVHGNLEPHVGQVYEGYASGTAFGGRSPSGELQAVRARYNNCLTDTVAQLAAYVDASSVLVTAAIELALRYRTADELAAARIDDVDRVLSNAVTAVQPGQDFGHDAAAGRT